MAYDRIAKADDVKRTPTVKGPPSNTLPSVVEHDAVTPPTRLAPVPDLPERSPASARTRDGLPGARTRNGQRQFVCDLSTTSAELVEKNKQLGEANGDVLIRALSACHQRLVEHFTATQHIAGGFVVEPKARRAPNSNATRAKTFQLSIPNATALGELMDACHVENYTSLIDHAISMAYGSAAKNQ
jgi:hypothetical protein